MKFWKIKSRERQAVARQELTRADKQLEDARAARIQAERINLSLREIRRANHITPSIFPPGRNAQ